MTNLTAQESLALGMIVTAAQHRQRCPANRDFRRAGIPYCARTLRRLVDLGLIEYEVAGQNWRTVWIIDGPFKGLSTLGTKAAPHPGKSYQRRAAALRQEVANA